jgi:hypothetical protein
MAKTPHSGGQEKYVLLQEWRGGGWGIRNENAQREALARLDAPVDAAVVLPSAGEATAELDAGPSAFLAVDLADEAQRALGSLRGNPHAVAELEVMWRRR